MDSENTVIYGLESQARALVPQLAETEKIRFLIGTQSPQNTDNQLHLIEFNEEASALKSMVYHHPFGEIWKVTSSPRDPARIFTCYNEQQSDRTIIMKTALLRLKDDFIAENIHDLELLTVLDTSQYGGGGSVIGTTEFHPNEDEKAATVLENNLVIWQITENCCKELLNIQPEVKNKIKYSTGKWNYTFNQFTATSETNLKTYDIRTGELAWKIENVHYQMVRDIDFNMNKQYHLATCGDDGFVKIWDFRQTSKPVFSRSDHSHWIWCVRFNQFHDELLLTASSDGRVLVTSASSVSSENNIIGITDRTKPIISDGPLQWCEHEDSVYCAEWSPADAWVFASLSYDGRLLLNRIKKNIKYQIML